MDFSLIKVSGIFNALYRVGFERVPFFQQLVHALRIRALYVGQSLQVSRFPTKTQFRLAN